ncbi:MAG TPA: low specificity L-threonine aldolase [Ferrovibrio sp.]|uniref:threonine aldolase family protein n=1 Tax=Ferrovibrio sp. TaxID=1917215 RepID=UPI002ED19837
MTHSLDFRSDNTSGAAPEVMAALAAANHGTAAAYGEDDWTIELDAAFSMLFDADCRVFPVATGTAANSLALSCLTPGFGAVYCHVESHIMVDECNAPEFFTGGAKLVGLQGVDGKVTPKALEQALSLGWRGVQHHPQPAALSITQATESGTVYAPDEIADLAGICRANGLRLHMDGARFANAVAGLNCSPADLTWRAGVEALSFGATKNGAMAAEAVVFFKPELAESFLYRRKRAGHLFSKARFLSVQLLAMLQDGLWLRLARQANDCARQLAEGLRHLPGVSLPWPVQANEVFAAIPQPMAEAMQRRGAQFHCWDPARSLYRFVCAFDKTADDVAALLKLAKEAR